MSSNIFSLDKESEKVNEGGTVKEGEKPRKEENEGAMRIRRWRLR